MWWIGLLSTGRAAECVERVPPQRLDEGLALAETAFGALDVARFHDAVDGAILALPCVDAVLAPSLAARYHRVLGLRQFVSRERDAARLSFLAARAVAPAEGFAAEVLPEAHAARALFDEATALPSAPLDVPPPASGVLAFDGTEGTARPAERPSIVQVVGASGAVEQTAWVLPSDPLPAYVVAPALVVSEPAPPAPVAAIAPVAPAADTRDGFRLRPMWAVGSGVALAGSGVLYALAASSASRFAEPDPTVALRDLEGQRRSTNSLVVGAGLAGGIGVAGLVGTIVVGF